MAREGLIMYLSAQDVADHFNVSLDTVYRWIEMKALRGVINISQGKRPTYRIPESSLSSVIRTVNQSRKLDIPDIV